MLRFGRSETVGKRMDPRVLALQLHGHGQNPLQGTLSRAEKGSVHGIYCIIMIIQTKYLLNKLVVLNKGGIKNSLN